MLSRGKVALAVFLSFALIQSSAFAEAVPSLGQVIQADRARLGLVAVNSGATLFDGDRLETGPGGSLRARLLASETSAPNGTVRNAAQVVLLADSAAALHRTGSVSSASIERGTVAFSSAAPEAFELTASIARIRARSAQPTLGQVTLLGTNEFVVSCERGELEVLVGDEVRTVAANSAYRVIVDPDEPLPQSGTHQTASAAQRHRSILLWVAVGAAAGLTAYFVWRALHHVSDP